MALVVYEGPQHVLDLTDEENNTAAVAATTKKKYVGLANQGATCYLNGLLQTLFMTPEFKKAIFSWHYDAEKDGPEDLCIPLQLQKLFGMLQLSTQRAVDTVALTKSFGWEGYEVFQQQDVQELTRVLFDALEETFKGTKFENVIDDLYAGELIDYIRCIDVNYQSERVDKFLDFSLAIIPFGSEQALHSLQACIETYLRPEILDGENKYYCEAFDQRVDAIKGLKFGKLPHIMSIQLKRFVYDFTGPSIVQKKLNDQVKFPMVLDMNKYVAKKKQRKLLQNIEDGENQVEEEEMIPNEEFEAFLQSQMQKLKHDKLHQPPQPTINYDDFMLEDDLYGFDYQGREMMYSDETGVMNITDDPDVPSLVQIDDAEVKTSNNAVAGEEDDQVIYDSMTSQQILDLLENRGEWVYELYAVLIHSGAISGGHYFAYIKDLHSKQWYDFNDSFVGAISEETVKEAWGGAQKTYTSTYQSSYGSLVGVGSSGNKTRLSNSNAYMLMYRKISAEDLKHVESNNEEDEDYVEVPEYIQKIIADEEAEIIRKQQEEEELRNRLNIKIIYKSIPKFVVTTRTATYQQLMEQIWNEFRLADICYGEVGNEQQPIDFDLFRLRDYNSYSKEVGQIYNEAENRNKTLGSLFFNDYRAYYLETRLVNEEWEAFIVDGMSIVVEEFDHLSQSFLEAQTIRIAKNATLGDLKDLLLKTTSIPREHMRVLKLASRGYHEGHAEELRDDSKQLREAYYIYEHSRVYVEDERNNPFETSQALHAFIEQRNRIQIKYNVLPSLECNQLISIDTRWRVQELRQFLANISHLEVEKCRLFKQNAKGNELKDGELTLGTNGIYSGFSICIVEGKVTPPGYFTLQVQEFEAKDVILGIMLLPLFPSHPEDGNSNEVDDAMLIEDFGDSNHHATTSTNPWDEIDMEVMTRNSDPKLMELMKNRSHDESPAQNHLSMVYPVQEEDDDVDNLSNQGQCDDMDNDFEDFPDIADVSPVPAYAVATTTSVESQLDALISDPEIEGISTAMASKVSFAENTLPDYDQQFPKLRTSTPIESAEAYEDTQDMPPLVHIDDVKPNSFGEQMVRNVIDGSQFHPLEDMEILVQGNTEVSQLRLMILQELIRIKRVPPNFSVHRIRIRERFNAILTKTLRDGKTLIQSGIYVTDNKGLAIQLLPEEEFLPEEEQGDSIVMLQRWNRSSWTLSERVEVLFPGNASVGDVAKALCLMFDIPVHALRVLVVPRETSFYLHELAQNAPPRNYGRYWFDPTKETKLMRYMSHDMRVSDGDLLILQNIDEPLKELSEQDKKSIEIVEATNTNNYSWSAYDTGSSLVPTWFNDSAASTTTTKSNTSGGGGIKIKTQKDRLKASESQSKLSSNPSTSSLDSNNNNHETLKNVATCSICGPAYQDSGVGTNDDLEFRRQGGYALFDDLV